MSFSKAKIQRFNDTKSCTPGPSKYNVSTQEKIKLGIISKTGQYPKSIESPQRSETGSTHSTPCFLTPTAPSKKKKFLGMSMSFRTPRTGAKLTEQEELQERIVECNNKDLYIKDLVEQLEEMTGKMDALQKDYSVLQGQKSEYEEALITLRQKNKEESLHRAKEFSGITNNLKKVNKELREIGQECSDLKNQNLVELSKLLTYIGKFEELYKSTVEASREELEGKNRELQKKEEENAKLKEEIRELRHVHKQETKGLKSQHIKQKEDFLQQLKESEARFRQLEEKFKDVASLTELQTKEEIEGLWRQKLEAKEQEFEAILKECQAISVDSITQSEIEKTIIKKSLEENERSRRELFIKLEKSEEEVSILKTEKHAYELSISTFRDTIEVLKKRLIDSDRDVVQLKEELEKCEERILDYERKCTELNNQLSETQIANEELEMQYESTSKIMQNQVKAIENILLEKVENLKEESRQLFKDRELLKQVLEQHHEQQFLLDEAQQTMVQSHSVIDSLEQQQIELEEELNSHKLKLAEEIEEAAEIRKKYIEKSGKYDELAHQFEQILQELDKAKGRVQELEKLIGPYQEQLEAYQTELELLNTEKCTLASEAEELSAKYAEIVGHHNLNQKVKHVLDLKLKSSELFQKNMDLESKNYKLNKMVEKLKKEVDELRKPGKKVKVDKENLVQSPGPLKNKN